MIPYEGKDLAESIEKAIFKCPRCMAVDSHTSKGDEFWCTECGKKYSVDKYGFIHGSDKFDNLHSWNMWQLDYIDEIYEKSMPFTSKDVKLTIVKNKRHKKTVCDFTLYKDKVTLGEIEIPAEDISSPNLVFTNTVEFFVGKTKYRIKNDPKRHTSITLIEKLLKKMVPKNEDEN